LAAAQWCTVTRNNTQETPANCQYLQGIDPIEARRSQRASQRLDAAKTIDFQKCADAYIASHRAGWKHPKHLHQWQASLATFVYPAIGSLPVAAIDTGLVMRCRTALGNHADATVHGMRSRFKDWRAEQTNFPDWISEKALAHLVGDESRRAYQRGDLLAKRRDLMAAWADYCGQVPAANIIPLRAAGAAK
jgi:hypothetical protein